MFPQLLTKIFDHTLWDHTLFFVTASSSSKKYGIPRRKEKRDRIESIPLTHFRSGVAAANNLEFFISFVQKMKPGDSSLSLARCMPACQMALTSVLDGASEKFLYFTTTTLGRGSSSKTSKVANMRKFSEKRVKRCCYSPPFSIWSSGARAARAGELREKAL